MLLGSKARRVQEEKGGREGGKEEAECTCKMEPMAPSARLPAAEELW
jgi:hypothetical protein